LRIARRSRCSACFSPCFGTLFAVLSIRDGRKLTKDLRSVFDHLTTKEIGAFPAYMAEVDRIISDARESVFIAPTFPAKARGGIAGATARTSRRSRTARRSASAAVIRSAWQVLCLDAQAARRRLQDRYRIPAGKSTVRRGLQRNRRLYEELENCQVSESDPVPAGVGSSASSAPGRRLALRGPLGVPRADADVPVDRRQREAVSRSQLGDHMTEYAFYTEEAGLVQALMSVWARYLESPSRSSRSPCW